MVIADNQLGVKLAQTVFDGADRGFGIALGADQQRFIGRKSEAVRQKNGGLHGMFESIVAGVAYHADYLQPIVGSRGHHKIRQLNVEHGAADVLADGVAIAEKLFDERLIDQRNMGGTHDFAVVVKAAPQQRDAQGGKFVGTDEPQHGLCAG